MAQGTLYQFKAPLSTDVDETAFKVAALSPAQADAVRADFLVYDQRTQTHAFCLSRDCEKIRAMGRRVKPWDIWSSARAISPKPGNGTSRR